MHSTDASALIVLSLFQVAFGSDFSQHFSDEDLRLKHVKGDGTIGFLIDNSFKGVRMAYSNPLYFVSINFLSSF